MTIVPPRSWQAWLRQAVGLLAAVALAGVVMAELFAWLLPQRLMEDGRWYLRLASVSLFIRVFQLHLGLATLPLVAVLLAVRWRKSAALGAVLVVAMLLPYARDFAPKHPPRAALPTVRLMSINLYARNRDEAAIMRAIDLANPDVLVLLEVTPWSLDNVIRKHLLGRYEYVTQPRAHGAGTVMTRLPFRIGESASNSRGSFNRHPVLLEVAGMDVALYAIHLISPGGPSLIAENRQQVTYFSEIARAEKRPTIIAGDCNFPQLSPNAAAFRRVGLRSSHELIGYGLGNTWGPRWWPMLNQMPGVRIDHIWLSPALTATSHTVGPDTGSDHRPVIADIGFAAPASTE